MIYFLNRFKIPTLLGLSIIFLGLGSGLFLTLREQTFLSKAAPDVTPQNLTLSNVTEDSIAISWQTTTAVAAFITYGQNSSNEQTALDDRDGNSPTARSLHYVSLKNLLPKTSYQFKIISGKSFTDIFRFETSPPLTNKTGFNPIIGTVLDGNNTLNDGIAYFTITGASTQSALIKAGGNFLIPVSQIATEGSIGKITILSDNGGANLMFVLKKNSAPLPPIHLGQNVDLTIPEETPEPQITNLDYDLNGDGKINSADYALLSSCLGKSPNTTLTGKSCTKTDINKDNSINQQDMDLMTQKFSGQ